MKLVDGAGTTVPWGETGELMVRSIYRFSEYRGMPEKFAETVDNDNWLRTEDLGIIIVSKNVNFTMNSRQSWKTGSLSLYIKEMHSSA